MTPLRRVPFGILAIATIAIGLVVHLGSVWMNPNVRDALGDALWAVMMTWIVSAIMPRARLVVRGSAALTVCYVVEASQLYHTLTLDWLRHTTLGHLVLGSGFDARDLVWYALGVMAAMSMEWMVRQPPPRDC